MKTHHTETVRLSIKSRLDDIPLLAAAIRGLCAELACYKFVVFQIEVAVVEAVSNVIQHAYRREPCHKVELLVRRSPEKITFAICDTGLRIEKPEENSVPSFSDSIGPLPESGYGLRIIEKSMDKVRRRSINGRNILTMSKSF